MAQALTPFPWAALDRLSRAEVTATTRARRWLARAIDLGRIADAAVDLLGVPVELQLRGISLDPGARTDAGVVIALAADGAPTVRITLEHALAARLAARVVSREVPWLDPSRAVAPEVAGAAAAFTVALARRAGDAPWRLAGSGPEGAVLRATFVVLLGDEVFSAECVLSSAALDPPSPAFDAAALMALGAVPIGLPLVAAASLATRSELEALVVGAAWAPGAGWTLRRDAEGAWAGAACLVAPRGETGLPVRVDNSLLREERSIVLTAGLSPSPWEGSPVTDTTRHTPESLEPLGDADVVVRVEVATVTMAARAWAAVAPGDVVATGVKLGETVILRAGGVAFARGELCDVEGELAVRIVERSGGTT